MDRVGVAAGIDRAIIMNTHGAGRRGDQIFVAQQGRHLEFELEGV
ncbi:hypothetical protein BN940_10716 [Castellaniella defragrans 65Phen]|uniref:Uncharacterized protein n=1 Tax=Castellaniella defragrans (strain DSM 12143 / CCUG 39792 / 65Phen) TaxID=1437824 RepID=W8WXX1_CASD6|nr:hypothetical protein BN940_10716 [Castellaniella defragrans 65Phen]